MNNESKIQNIIKAVKSRLETVEYITKYAKDIRQSNTPYVINKGASISIDCDHGQSNDGLSSSDYFLKVIVCVSTDMSNCNSILNNLGFNIDNLLDRKADELSAVDPNDTLRCRYIRRTGSTKVYDQLIKSNVRTLTFSLICDDDILENL